MYGTTTELEALTMDHLVTMTTHTPAGTGQHSVDEIGTLQDAENQLARRPSQRLGKHAHAAPRRVRSWLTRR